MDNSSGMQTEEMKQMLIEYMEKGFLENIIALFKTDPSLYGFIPDMLGQDNLRVRLGTAALVEELIKGHGPELRAIVPLLTRLLKHENPTVKGDAAYVLGIIKDPATEGALTEMLNDENAAVRESAREALQELGTAEK